MRQDGFVFHSIKQESDYQSNLFTGRLAATGLARSMQADPEADYIDFESYGPSGEAAAFFVVPLAENQELVGWFVLQYASNELVALLDDRQGLGRTGEVYIVNRDRLMLSDSRFASDSTVLDQAVDSQAIHNAQAKGTGHTMTEDYRGVRVFSSYTTLEFFNTSWTVVVEIDEDEIISDHLKENMDRLLPDLVAAVSKSCHMYPLERTERENLTGSNRVDMGEVHRVADRQIGWTAGVGPCTGIVAYYPGRFGYLTHLGPTDDVYIDDPLTRSFLGSQRTSHLNELVQRIKYFDVVPNNLKNVQFVVVASHTDSIEGILTTLLGQGIDLAQIRFLYHPDADFANILFKRNKDTITVHWIGYRPHATTLVSKAGSQESLSSLLKQAIGYGTVGDLN